MPRCVVPGCHRRNTSTHFFPSDPVRRQQWVDFVKRIDPDFPAPGQYSCICGAHFETRCYNFSFWIDKEENSFGSKTPRRTLSEEAVPTLVGNEKASSLDSLMQLSDSGAISMIQGLPPSGMITQNGNQASVETHTKKLPITSPIANTVKSNAGGRNYTVAMNQAGQKVCIFRPLAQKNASITTSNGPVVSLSIATTKATTITTSSTQPVSSIVKLASPNMGQNHQIIMLQDGAPVKVLKTNSSPQNLEKNGKRILKQTIVHRQPVKLTTIQTSKTTSNTVQTPKSTIHYKPTAEKVIPAPTKKLFTVDELDKLPKLDFLQKFTTKVKIMDSRNFAMRCQLIKSCPFIISCPSESDCHDVMFLHLKKHITTLRARQEGNKVPYKISTGVKLGSTPVNTAQAETITREKINGLSTVIGGIGSIAMGQHVFQNGNVATNVHPTQLNVKHGIGSIATRQNVIQNGGVATNINSSPLNIKQTFMKVFPVSKVNINPTSANQPMTTTQSTLNAGTIISTIPVRNKTVKAPIVFDSRNVPITNIGTTGPQMVVQMGKQLKVVQGTGSSVGSGTSPNMTFLLVPLAKPAGAPAEPVKSHGPTPSILKNQSASKKTGGFSKIFRPCPGRSTTVLRKASLLPAVSLNSNASPLDITNEMILKAKAVLDKQTAGQTKIPAARVNDQGGPLPKFQLKITLPRLYDLAKHAIMKGNTWDSKLAQFLSHIHSRKPLSKKEIKAGVFARGEPNPGTGKSSFGVYMARKNEFLSSRLHLERVGSKKLTERCKQRVARTRLQRQKLRKQLKKSTDHQKSRHLSHRKNSHSNICNDGIFQKKRSRKSVLWWRGPPPKRIKHEIVNQPKKVKFKPCRKPDLFWYATPESSKKSSQKDNVDKPLKDILQSGLIVLKRNATKLPHREIVSPKKMKNCEEVKIGGKVIKIKQEPVSDDEFNDPIDIDNVPDRLLQPPSDDDMDDLFPDDNTASDIETTDSESEFCIAKKKAQKVDSTVSSAASVPRSEFVEEEVDVPLLAIKYFQRLCEVIRVTREKNAAGPTLLPVALKKCKICSVEFERVDVLLHHYKQHASEVQKTPCNEYAEDPLPKTSTKRSQNKNRKRSLIKKYNGVYHYDKPFKCELCQMRFYTCKTFEEHLIESHSHSTKAMAHVLFSQSGHSPQVANSSIYDLVLPDLNVPKASEETPASSRSLNDLLIENEHQIASDSLECHSPPLPKSPKARANTKHSSNSLRPFVKTNKTVESKEAASMEEAAPDLQPIKLTLFPRNGSGLSRISFANNRKLLES